MTWLDALRLELDNMDPESIKDPTSQERNPTCDTVVATIEDLQLKKLYTLGMQWKRTAMELGVKLQFESDATEAARLQEEASQLMRKSELVNQIVWVSVRDTYSLWDKDSLHFCKGWQIVECNSHPGSDIRDILGGLFGR